MVNKIDREDYDALKIHGYIFSSGSSGSEDSGKSDFDEEYYALKPPPINIDKIKTNHRHRKASEIELNTPSTSTSEPGVYFSKLKPSFNQPSFNSRRSTRLNRQDENKEEQSKLLNRRFPSKNKNDVTIISSNRCLNEVPIHRFNSIKLKTPGISDEVKIENSAKTFRNKIPSSSTRNQELLFVNRTKSSNSNKDFQINTPSRSSTTNFLSNTTSNKNNSLRGSAIPESHKNKENRFSATNTNRNNVDFCSTVNSSKSIDSTSRSLSSTSFRPTITPSTSPIICEIRSTVVRGSKLVSPNESSLCTSVLKCINCICCCCL